MIDRESDKLCQGGDGCCPWHDGYSKNPACVALLSPHAVAVAASVSGTARANTMAAAQYIHEIALCLQIGKLGGSEG